MKPHNRFGILFVLLFTLSWLAIACGGDVTVPDINEETTDSEVDPTDEDISNEDEAEMDEEEMDEEEMDEEDDEGEEGSTGGEAVADLPRLPSLNSQADGGGFGGGFATAESETMDLPATDIGMSSMLAYNIFSGTTFILDTTPPPGPGTGTVYERQPLELTYEQALVLAERFGFTPPLYQEVIPPEFLEGEEADFFLANRPYYVFTENGMLNISSFNIFYENRAANDIYPSTLPFEQAAAITEQFLQERGLIDFEYELTEGFGGDVWVKRQIGEFDSNFVEFYVNVDSDGVIRFVSQEALADFVTLGDYPLISAEQAFSDLEVQAADGRLLWEIVFDESEVLAVEPAIELPEDFNYWTRQYAAGDEINLYGSPIVYSPAGEDGEPLIQMAQYFVNADPGTLQALSEQLNQPLRILATLDENGRSVTLTSWELLDDFSYGLFEEGVAVVTDQDVRFTTPDGRSFILPDAPADLEDGTEIFVFYWGVQENGSDVPSAIWETIEEKVDYETFEEEADLNEEDSSEVVDPAESFIVDEPFFPPTLESITITGIDLIYYPVTDYGEVELLGGDVIVEPRPTDITTILQPTWRFSGSGSDGSEYLLFVSAVAPEYLNSGE